MERCRREITAIEAEILAGNPDLPGLCLALADWNTELRILEQETCGDERQERRQAGTQRRADGTRGSQTLTE